MNILVYQVSDDTIRPYARYTSLINNEYASKHGYDFLHAGPLEIGKYYPSWQKVFWGLNLLDMCVYDYVVFIDSDAVFWNHDIKIEEKIQKMKSSMAFSENGANGGELINTGVFIARHDASKILSDCISLSTGKLDNYKLVSFHEQSVFNYMHEHEMHKFDVFDMNEINSYGGSLSSDRDFEDRNSQYIHHFMAKTIEEKTRIAKKLWTIYKKQGHKNISR